MSMKQKRTMEDAEGNEICGYQQKMLTMHGTSYITIKDQGGATLVVATIKKQSNFFPDSSADVYLHNPPVHIDNVTTSGLPIAIYVEGELTSKKYDFMMGNIMNNPFKIAQVVKRYKAFDPTDSYFIEIGPNVDVAFTCICAYAIDELFSENDN